MPKECVNPAPPPKFAMTPEKSSCQPVCLGCATTAATPLFCFSCNSIQRLNSKPNYFEIFGLSYSYELDLEELEESYQKLASELHPDYYLTASANEKRQSQESSALLNKAFVALQAPDSRAQYLLSLLAHGQKLDERRLPDGLLQEMFFLQESLEEELDADPKSANVAKIEQDVKERQDQSNHEIAHDFARYSDEKEKVHLLQDIQTHLNTNKYLQRLLDRIQRSKNI